MGDLGLVYTTAPRPGGLAPPHPYYYNWRLPDPQRYCHPQRHADRQASYPLLGFLSNLFGFFLRIPLYHSGTLDVDSHPTNLVVKRPHLSPYATRSYVDIGRRTTTMLSEPPATHVPCQEFAIVVNPYVVTTYDNLVSIRDFCDRWNKSCITCPSASPPLAKSAAGRSPGTLRIPAKAGITPCLGVRPKLECLYRADRPMRSIQPVAGNRKPHGSTDPPSGGCLRLDTSLGDRLWCVEILRPIGHEMPLGVLNPDCDERYYPLVNVWE